MLEPLLLHLAATWLISSSDGVISPDTPIMSAFSATRCRDLLRQHHHPEVDHLEVVAGQSTTPTMFLPMSCTSPLTVAITILPLELADVAGAQPFPPR